MSNFPYDPLISHFERFNTTFDPGDFNDVEIWIELNDQYSPHLPRLKVSNSVTLGKVGQLTFAREWTKSEEADLKKITKSRTPPVGLPDGMVRVAADTKLVPGLPIHAGWMGEWEPAEVISIMDNGLVLVKYDSNNTKALLLRTREWIAVSPETLKIAAESPQKYKPSLKVRPGGTLPVPEGYVELDDKVSLVPGTPIKLEARAIPFWQDAFFVKTLPDGTVEVRQDRFRFLGGKTTYPLSSCIIEKSVLEELKRPGAAEKFAVNLESFNQFETVARDPVRGISRPRIVPKWTHSVDVPIPDSAVQLTKDMPVEPGTKLGACWARRWQDVTVKSVEDDGTLHITWDGHSDSFAYAADRDQLIIQKTVLARLNANQPKKMAKAPPASSKPKDADKPQTGDRFRLVLKSHGNRKIPVTKVVVDITGIDLKEAGEYVDSCPITLKQNLTKQDAESLRNKLESAGAEVALELQ